MLSYLYGKIVEKSPTTLVLDVNNVGYNLQVTINCSRNAGQIGDEVKILTHLHVREDNLQLFGFVSAEERELFLQLTTTPGIGPKKALAILSGSGVEDLRRFILQEDLTALTGLPGVGRKTAQRLIVDLKEKLDQTYAGSDVEVDARTPSKQSLVEEAVLALVSLGYQHQAARKAITAILKDGDGDVGLEDLIKQALRKL